ncbi:MAG: hypothetical protein AAF629_04985 [Chloroflexota bacterium]
MWAIQNQVLTIVVATLVLLIGFLGVMMVTGVGDLGFFEPSDQQKRSAAIFQLNLERPKDLGNGMQLDQVSSSGNGVVYQFTLTQVSSSQVDTGDFYNAVFETSHSQICSQPDLRAFINEDGGFVEAAYLGNDGVFITSIRFDESTC